MAYTLRPLSIGELLDVTFDLYRKNFGLFVGISALPYVAMLALQMGQTLVTSLAPKGIGSAIIGMFGSLIVAFVSLAVGSVITAATTFGVSDIYLGVPTSVGQCFSHVSGKVLKVVYVSFVFGLAVVVGLVLLIVPGVYWAGKYGIAIPAAVLENGSGGDALNRSSQLTKGFVGRMIVVYFMSALIGMIVVMGASFGLVFLFRLAHVGLLATTLAQQVVSAIVGIFIAPISSIALTLAYYDQRIRKEGFDIERMMSLLDVSTPPPPFSAQTGM